MEALPVVKKTSISPYGRVYILNSDILPRRNDWENDGDYSTVISHSHLAF